MRRIAILAAMEQEVADLRAELVVDPAGTRAASPAVGGRDYLAGTLWGVPVVLAWSRWGKVAAAVTTTHVLAAFEPSCVIFTGVAGSLHPAVGVGDIVVAESLVQHDMDASPLFPRHEIPLLGLAEFPGDAEVRDGLLRSARHALQRDLPAALPDAVRQAFGIHQPAAHIGQITSGDRFISGDAVVADLRQRLPAALCVEMEGAAVAQVCHEHGVPFGVVRIISDRADDNAGTDFPAFLQQVAGRYTHAVLQHYLQTSSRA